MATIDDIRNYFEDILQRSGTEVTDAEINSYVSAVDSGALTLAQARAALINSSEGETVQDVVRLYQTFFGRVPDQQGLNDQVDTLRNGPGTIENLANGFAASQEFRDRFGSNTVTEAFINSVYQQVLGRTPAASEVQFYLDSGFSAGRIALAFSESPEFVAATQDGVEQFLDEAGLGTQDYTGSLDSTGNVGRTIGLTAGIDAGDDFTGTSGNDTFIGDATTAQVADTLDGGAGVDTLRLVNTDALPTISNIERIELTNNTADQDLDASGVTGLTEVAFRGAVTGSSATTAAGVITTLDAVGTAATAVAAFTATTAASATAQTIQLTNGSNVTTLTADGAAVTNLTLQSNGSAANTIGTLAGTAGATAATDATLTLAGSQLLTITNAIDTGFATVNASGTSGGVDLTFGANTVAVTGGSGADVFNFGVNLGAGDAVVGGAGTDTISIDNQTVGAGALLTALNTQVTGVEVLEFVDGAGAAPTVITGGTGTGAFTNAEITKILFNTTDVDTVNSAGSARTYAFGADNDGDATFNLGSGVTTVNLSLEGSAAAGADVDVVTINPNASAPTGQTATVNIASTGSFTTGNTTGALTAAAGSTFNVTGSQDLTIAGIANGGTLNAATFTGDLTATGSTVNDIITGGSGADVLSGLAGIDTINGGAGNDTITGGVGADLLTGGAGADIFVVSTATGATDSTDTAFDSISDWNAGGTNDVLRLSAADNVAGVATTAPVATSSVQIDAGGKVTFAAADDTFAERLAAVQADNTNIAAREVVFFESDGDTYVYGAGTSTTTATDDFLIKLTGVTGLTTLTESTTTAGDFSLT